MIEDRGYAVIGGGAVRILAALDEAAAVDLLRAALATVPAGEEIGVEWITSLQDWAIGPCSTRASRSRTTARCSCAVTSGRSGPISRAGHICSRYGFPSDSASCLLRRT